MEAAPECAASNPALKRRPLLRAQVPLTILVVANNEARASDQQTESGRRRATSEAEPNDCQTTFGEAKAATDGVDLSGVKFPHRSAVVGHPIVLHSVLLKMVPTPAELALVMSNKPQVH